MFSSRRKAHLLYFFVDVLFITLSFYCNYKFNPHLLPEGHLALRTYLPIFVFWGMSLVILLKNSRLYHTDRYVNISTEWFMVSRCVLFSAILVALMLYVAKITAFSRTIFLFSMLYLSLNLSLWRTFKRIYVRHLISRGYSNFNVLIVGAGKAGIALSEEIRTNPYLGVKIVGFLDDNKTKQVNGYKVLGKIGDLEEVVKQHFVDEIHITIPSERKITSEIINKGIKLRRTVRIIPENFGLPFLQAGLNSIGSLTLLTYFERKPHGTESFAKRMTDIVLAASVLIILSPLFLTIGFLIKLDSPGPLFYVSKRCGKKGRIFNFYKFRSMIYDADKYKGELLDKSEVKGPIFKIRQDPRITRVGRLIRKYSLDELPQLINVVKGDMSMVGPRPFPVKESQSIENRYIMRLNIRPGITGLAQIKGRSDLSFNHWMRWDFWYLNNWSLGLDLKILWWTLPVILKGEGAY